MVLEKLNRVRIDVRKGQVIAVPTFSSHAFRRYRQRGLIYRLMATESAQYLARASYRYGHLITRAEAEATIHAPIPHYHLDTFFKTDGWRGSGVWVAIRDRDGHEVVVTYLGMHMKARRSEAGLRGCWRHHVGATSSS